VISGPTVPFSTIWLEAEIAALEEKDDTATQREAGWRERQIEHLNAIIATLENS
jgi:hypothetical protein